tara:strand:- start:46 stop:363 length:318 start_codon:yes stop_codon:yes gene_type:complete
MDAMTLAIIKQNQKSNVKPALESLTDNKEMVGKNLREEFSNKGKQIDLGSLKKDSVGSPGKILITKDEIVTSQEQGDKQAKNLRGLIGSIMEMKEDIGQFNPINL